MRSSSAGTCSSSSAARRPRRPWPEPLWRLVAAGELMYVPGLVSMPRFRAAIDAKVHAQRHGATPDATPQAAPVSLSAMLSGLPPPDRSRFEQLHARCLE